jgi:hypothetical protein
MEHADRDISDARVEDRAFSLCTEKRVYDRGTTGAEHGKDESVDTNVFGDSGIHNEA